MADNYGQLHKYGMALKEYIFGFNPFELHSFVNWAGEWCVSRALVCSVLFTGLLGILWLEIPNLPMFALEWFVGLAPVWMPICLIIGGWHVWIWYIQSLFLAGRKPILLEMKIPREITKSPRAMELAFGYFSYSAGETTFLSRAWKGQVRPFFPFEIASFGGQLHFYIWCWDNYRRTVEGAIYGQYPEVEIYQVEDYAAKFRFDPKKYDAWGVDWPLTGIIKDFNDFRINAYPLKTYVDYELDKDPKEEFKVDPLGQILEFMSNIQPHEQLWVQIVIRKSGKKGILLTYEQDEKWKKMVTEEIDKLRVQAALVPENILDEEKEKAKAGEDARPQIRPSWRQTRQMESMERNLGKYPFEVGMRGIYWTEKELHGPTFTGFRWMWRPFGNAQYMTQLRPRRWHCDFDYPWQDFNRIRWVNTTWRVLDAYRRRMFFHSPWIVPTNIMTNEVLASLWHPPSSSIVVPGLQRIPATKAAPPPNLPK